MTPGQRKSAHSKVVAPGVPSPIRPRPRPQIFRRVCLVAAGIYTKKELSVSERLRAVSRVTGGVDWSEARQ